MKSKGRVTYWATRHIGEDQIKEDYFVALNELQIMPLKDIINDYNKTAKRFEKLGRMPLELVRVELTPV